MSGALIYIQGNTLHGNLTTSGQRGFQAHQKVGFSPFPGLIQKRWEDIPHAPIPTGKEN